VAVDTTEQKRNSEYKVTEFSVTFLIFIRNVCWREIKERSCNGENTGAPRLPAWEQEQQL
jgi:hypothetical protein